MKLYGQLQLAQRHPELFTRHRQPSETELRAAYYRRRNDAWPGSFEQAMASDLYRRLIAIEAAHPGNKDMRRLSASWEATQSQYGALGAYDPIHDIKRRASGERLED